MYWNHDMMGWFGGFGMIFFWAVLIIVIIVLFRLLTTKTDGRPGHRETPLEILERRYASVEIDKAEFDEKKRDLQL